METVQVQVIDASNRVVYDEMIRLVRGSARVRYMGESVYEFTVVIKRDNDNGKMQEIQRTYFKYWLQEGDTLSIDVDH